MDTESTRANNKSDSDTFGKVFRILVIGETGSGKSTLINYMTNYFLEGSLDHLKFAIPTRYREATEKFSHSETNLLDPTTSQTTQCTEYHFVDQRTSNHYIFIDTPGISDIRGIQHDEINIKNILDAVGKLKGLSAILTVFNGIASRMSVNIINILTRLHGCLSLGNCLNIVVLSNTYEWTSSLDIQRINLHTGEMHPFYIQMSAFCTNLNKLSERARMNLKYDWEESIIRIQKIIELIQNLAPHF